MRINVTKTFILGICMSCLSLACGSEESLPDPQASQRSGINPVELTWEKPEGVQPLDEMTTVDAVDLERYLGDWYEIASIPAWFEAYCEAGVKANYTLKDDGNIRVINSCYDANGSLRELEGVAAPRAATETSKLQVAFGSDDPAAFGANYWVLYLTDAYDLALVGEPGRDYGWVLSRTPEFTQERLNEVAVEIERQGYEIDQFELTDQTPNLD